VWLCAGSPYASNDAAQVAADDESLEQFGEPRKRAVP